MTHHTSLNMISPTHQELLIESKQTLNLLNLLGTIESEKGLAYWNRPAIKQRRNIMIHTISQKIPLIYWKIEEIYDNERNTQHH